jgi:energy-converting hydrogenase B subunit D
MLTALQVAALALVAVSGTAVVITREPLRQVIVLGFFGLQLAVLFFTFQAPDVALSAITVTAVLLPLMILAALARMRRRSR